MVSFVTAGQPLNGRVRDFLESCATAVGPVDWHGLDLQALAETLASNKPRCRIWLANRRRPTFGPGTFRACLTAYLHCQDRTLRLGGSFTRAGSSICSSRKTGRRT